MAASVLNSDRAIQVSVVVIRTFIRLRQLLSTNKHLYQKLKEVEARLEDHDGAIKNLVKIIGLLMEDSESEKKRPIGFAKWDDSVS